MSLLILEEYSSSILNNKKNTYFISSISTNKLVQRNNLNFFEPIQLIQRQQKIKARFQSVEDIQSHRVIQAKVLKKNIANNPNKGLSNDSKNSNTLNTQSKQFN